MNRTAAAEHVPVLTHLDDRLRTTSMCLAVGHGARHDPAHQGGLSHLLEHLLMSAPFRGRSSVAEHVERLGGDANAETGPEMMTFTAQIHAGDAEEAADLLIRSVLTPEPSDRSLDDERAVVLQELATAAADPSDVVQDRALAAMFPDHPLGRPTAGTVDGIRATTLADLLDHHRDDFLTRPMALVVVGPEVPAAARFRRPVAQRAPDPPVPVADVAPGPPTWPTEFSWLCASAYGPAAGDPRHHAYDLLARLMGSSPASLLYRRLRNESGLVYAFEAWPRGYTERGLWRLIAGIGPGNGPAVLTIVRSTLDELATRGPDAADLGAVRRQAEMRLVRGSEVPAELAPLIARRTRAGTVPWTPEAELAAITAVTAEDVRRAAGDVLTGLHPVVAA